jgi:hypothetical protein
MWKLIPVHVIVINNEYSISHTPTGKQKYTSRNQLTGELSIENLNFYAHPKTPLRFKKKHKNHGVIHRQQNKPPLKK